MTIHHKENNRISQIINSFPYYNPPDYDHEYDYIDKDMYKKYILNEEEKTYHIKKKQKIIPCEREDNDIIKDIINRKKRSNDVIYDHNTRSYEIKDTEKSKDFVIRPINSDFYKIYEVIKFLVLNMEFSEDATIWISINDFIEYSKQMLKKIDDKNNYNSMIYTIQRMCCETKRKEYYKSPSDEMNEKIINIPLNLLKLMTDLLRTE